MNSRSASLVAFVVLVAVIVVLVLRHSLFASNLSGVAVQVLAVLLMLWARLTLRGRSFRPTADPSKGNLVTTGPYRFIRHPIYAAVLYFLVAGVAFHVSLMNSVLVLIAVVAIGVRILAEERLLVEQYPEYTAYAARTKRVIPFVL